MLRVKCFELIKKGSQRGSSGAVDRKELVPPFGNDDRTGIVRSSMVTIRWVGQSGEHRKNMTMGNDHRRRNVSYSETAQRDLLIVFGCNSPVASGWSRTVAANSLLA